MNPMEWMQEGGWVMWVILTSCCVVVPLGLLHVVVARPWSLVVTLLLAGAPCCIGAGGTLQGKMQVDNALQFVNPEDRAMLEEVGNREATRPILFGVIVAGLALFPIALGEVRRLTRKEPPADA
jgi:hypothetical protein